MNDDFCESDSASGPVTSLRIVSSTSMIRTPHDQFASQAEQVLQPMPGSSSLRTLSMSQVCRRRCCVAWIESPGLRLAPIGDVITEPSGTSAERLVSSKMYVYVNRSD